MELRRTGAAPHDALSTPFILFEGSARADFHSFEGQGSHLMALVSWSDVEALIEFFVKAEHPEALNVNRAVQLASAVQAIVSSKMISNESQLVYAQTVLDRPTLC